MTSKYSNLKHIAHTHKNHHHNFCWLQKTTTSPTAIGDILLWWSPIGWQERKIPWLGPQWVAPTVGVDDSVWTPGPTVWKMVFVGTSGEFSQIYIYINDINVSQNEPKTSRGCHWLNHQSEKTSHLDVFFRDFRALNHDVFCLVFVSLFETRNCTHVPPVSYGSC